MDHINEEFYAKLMHFLDENAKDISSGDLVATMSFFLGRFAFEHAEEETDALKAIIAYAALGITYNIKLLEKEIENLK